MASGSAPDFERTVEGITGFNLRWSAFWRSAHGWAPDSAVDVLADSRLDWQVELSRCLRLWASLPDNEEGRLILAWTNLGSLVESSLRVFLAVFLEDYMGSPAARRNGDVIAVKDAEFHTLREYFRDHDVWGVDGSAWDSWILHIQHRRNAIHSFKDRHIGSLAEFHDDVARYLQLLGMLDARLPYPEP